MKQLITIVTAISLFSNVYAQSPGGVSGAGTNQLWLDANQLSLSNNNPVTTWTDKSGKGNNATMTTTSRKPTFKTTQLNGLPSVVFDGTSDFMQTGAIAAMNVGTISQFMVFDGSGSAQTGVILGGNYTTHSQFLLNVKGSGQYRTWVIKSPNTIVDNLGALNSSYQIMSSLWDSGTGIISSYKDGASFGSKAGATTVPSGNNYFRIGANSSGGGSYYFNAGIAEVILYSKTLNSAERNIVTNYLGAKYNLAIANDYYAFEATHGKDLIGVGQEADGSNNTATGISILRMSNPTTLANGEYIMIGNDGVALSPSNTSDVPTLGNVRFGRVWRVDIQGATETVDITFDLSSNSLGASSGYRLLVDDNGVFSTGAVEIPGVYDGGTQTITFSGVNLTAGQYITLMNNASGIQSTGVTSDWHTTTTWTCGCIPGLGSQVTILAGHTVSINGANALASNLTIDATGALTFGGTDTLTLDQNLTNNGTITAGNGGFNFTSTTAQTIAGTQIFNNLIIDNSSGVSISSGTSSVQGFLDVRSGSFSTNNSLTLLSNSTGTAVIKNLAAGTIVGNVTAQRYVNEIDKWYLIASPLTNADIEDWNQEFEMQGFAGTENPNQWPSVYYYNESAIVSDWYDGYKAPASTANIATNGVGWSAYIDNDSKATGPRSINLTGTPRLGDGITLNGTNSNVLANPDESGWNLFGNPYAAPIRWGSVSKTNVIAGYRKGTNGSFYAMNNGTSIASGEGFWVQFGVGGGSVTFDANDIAASFSDTYNQKQSSTSFQEGDVTYFKLKLIFDSNNEDMVEIGFAPNATDGLDIGKDAIKLKTSNLYDPNLSIEIANRHYARNIFNDHVDNLEIPLNISTVISSSVTDNYTLVFEGMDGLLKSNKQFQLEDRTLGEFYEILGDTSFSFTMLDDVKATRFFLQVKEPINIIAVNNVSCASANDGNITVKGNGSGPFTYTWKDVSGNVLKTTSMTTHSDSFESLAGGNYSVEVQNSGSFGTSVYNFVITEPNTIVSTFSSNEDNEIINWAYSNNQDTLYVNTNKSVSFINESNSADTYVWDFGDFTNSSLKNANHIYFNSGIYKASLTAKKGACEVESFVYVNVNAATSISETNLLDEIHVLVKENNILVYMNNQNKTGNVKFEVLNAVGQVVYSNNKVVSNNHIETIHLDKAAGLYFISIEGFGNSKTKKIVLN